MLDRKLAYNIYIHIYDQGDARKRKFPLCLTTEIVFRERPIQKGIGLPGPCFPIAFLTVLVASGKEGLVPVVAHCRAPKSS